MLPPAPAPAPTLAFRLALAALLCARPSARYASSASMAASARTKASLLGPALALAAAEEVVAEPLSFLVSCCAAKAPPRLIAAPAPTPAPVPSSGRGDASGGVGLSTASQSLSHASAASQIWLSTTSGRRDLRQTLPMRRAGRRSLEEGVVMLRGTEGLREVRGRVGRMFVLVVVEAGGEVDSKRLAREATPPPAPPPLLAFLTVLSIFSPDEPLSPSFFCFLRSIRCTSRSHTSSYRLRAASSAGARLLAGLNRAAPPAAAAALFPCKEACELR